MRLWKLQDLFDNIHRDMPKAKKHLTLLHICENCGWRTPELSPLQPIDMNINVPAHPPITYEIKNHGLCDKCNQSVWGRIKDDIEYSKNHCIHCDGGRCRHYLED